jgi:hypothetical protein
MHNACVRETNNNKKQGVPRMKNTYSIVNIATNEIISVQSAFPPCRDICRAYLTNPDNFGARLHVIKNIQPDGTGEVVFDVTSIRYSSGRVRMTLWTEFNRQMRMHEETARKLREREEAKLAMMKPAAPTNETPEAPTNEKPAAKKSAKKSK